MRNIKIEVMEISKIIKLFVALHPLFILVAVMLLGGLTAIAYACIVGIRTVNKSKGSLKLRLIPLTFL